MLIVLEEETPQGFAFTFEKSYPNGKTAKKRLLIDRKLAEAMSYEPFEWAREQAKSQSASLEQVMDRFYETNK